MITTQAKDMTMPENVLPFDNTPMRQSFDDQFVGFLRSQIMRAANAIIDDECDGCVDDDEGYHDVCSQLEELQGVNEAWIDVFCDLFDTPRALIEDHEDARRWGSMLVIKS